MALQDKGGCRRNPRLAEKENETRGDRDRYGYLHHYHEVSLHLSRQDYAGTKEQQPILPDRIMNKQEYETLSAIDGDKKGVNRHIIRYRTWRDRMNYVNPYPKY